MVPQSNRLLMSEESIWKPLVGKEKTTLSDAAEGSRNSTSSTPSNLIPISKKEKSTADRLKILKDQKSF